MDGYNIIFAWPELRELAKINLDSARDKLMDILCNYQGYQGCRLILVYDAYKVKDNPGSTMKYHNIEVVYTKKRRLQTSISSARPISWGLSRRNTG